MPISHQNKVLSVRDFLKEKALSCIALFLTTAGCNQAELSVPGLYRDRIQTFLENPIVPLTKGNQSSQMRDQPRTDFLLLIGRADSILQLHLLVSAAFYKELKSASDCHLHSVTLIYIKGSDIFRSFQI